MIEFLPKVLISLEHESSLPERDLLAYFGISISEVPVNHRFIFRSVCIISPKLCHLVSPLMACDSSIFRQRNHVFPLCSRLLPSNPIPTSLRNDCHILFSPTRLPQDLLHHLILSEAVLLNIIDTEAIDQVRLSLTILLSKRDPTLALLSGE